MEKVCIESVAHEFYVLLVKSGFCWRARNFFFNWEKKKKSAVLCIYIFAESMIPFSLFLFLTKELVSIYYTCLTIQLSMQHPITNADPLSQKKMFIVHLKGWKGFCGLNVVTYFTALGSMEYFDNCNSSMKLVISSFNYFSLNRFGVNFLRLVFWYIIQVHLDEMYHDFFLILLQIS